MILPRKARGRASRSTETEPGSDFDRIVFFSDAVFAIAITLLTIEIKVPELDPKNLTTELPHALLGLWPQVLVYVQTFILIGLHWQGHHRMFKTMVRYDQTLIWLNTLFLLCIAFIPVPSATLGQYYNQPSASVFFSLWLFLTSAMSLLMWRYASRRRRLLKSNVPSTIIHYAFRRGIITMAMALLAAGLALVNTVLASGLWLLFLIINVPLSSLYERVLMGKRRE